MTASAEHPYCEGAVWRGTMPADLQAVRDAVRAVRDFQTRSGLAAADLDAWELLLMEAANNVVVHSGSAHEWRMEVMVGDAETTAVITDHTAGFELPESAPLPPPDFESGRGLFLIFSLTDARRYERRPGENVLTLVRRNQAPLQPHSAQEDELESTLTAMTEELAASYESLSAIFRFTSEISRSAAGGEIPARSLHDLLPVAGADWFVFRNFDPDSATLRTFAAAPGEAPPPLPVPAEPGISEGLEVQAARTCHDFWFDEVSAALSSEDPLRGLGRPLAGLVHPVIAGGELLGVFSIGVYSGEAPFKAGQVNVIHTFADFLGIQLRNARAQEQSVKAQLVTRELEIAATIQQSLLPRQLPVIPGWSIAGSALSASQVGGDFYDAFAVEGGVLLAIADVMGKGVPAAMFAAIFRSHLHARPDLAPDPAEFMSWLNRVLFDDLDRVDMFITAQLAFLDFRGTLKISGAGHCPALLSGGGQVTELATDDPPLGILRGHSYRQVTTEPGPQASLLLYTDGVTDASNPVTEPLGIGRLMDWMKGIAGDADGAGQSLRDIISAHQENCRATDDVTFIVLTAQ